MTMKGRGKNTQKNVHVVYGCTLRGSQMQVVITELQCGNLLSHVAHVREFVFDGSLIRPNENSKNKGKLKTIYLINNIFPSI